MAMKSDNTNLSSPPCSHAAQASQPDLIEPGWRFGGSGSAWALTQAQLSLVSGTNRDTNLDHLIVARVELPEWRLTIEMKRKLELLTRPISSWQRNSLG
jgi:hypothetical protein